MHVAPQPSRQRRGLRAAATGSLLPLVALGGAAPAMAQPDTQSSAQPAPEQTTPRPATEAQTDTSTPSPGPATAGQQRTAERVYTVRAGDSPWLISQRYDVPLERLLELNDLTMDSIIHVGQRMVLDDGASAAEQPATPQRQADVEQPAAQDQTAPAAVERTADAAPTADATVQQSREEVGNTFLGHVYPDHVVTSANENLARLRSAPVPTPGEAQQLIRQEAQRMGVDPALALGHAYTESNFRHDSVSPANSVGLMQVMPYSGEFASQVVGRELNLLDPRDNVIAGLVIIRHNQALAANQDEAIGAYYQGLGGIQREGFEPFTHTYIARVKAAAAMF
ncbi:soluble lytic murein transglycosylase-like protein [Micrococcus cohnii]|mgnify:FL=1|uniref:Soluble lytic murein transglycosylase-like protein n=1 Tax=Micrococcus cohnii TaxID=993416 RepID=A0A7W7GNL0_9MICC|nr:transglycosylase SLT domain-containing protein [Micrococcus cohnii]MBB4735448.1 soluble lytic murein transglycosylase-like protein [Micrococcus cohnii]